MKPFSGMIPPLAANLCVVPVCLGGCAEAGEAPTNWAAARSGAAVAGPQNASGSRGKPNCVSDGEVTDYGPSHGYAWAFLKTPLLVKLAEPRRINKIDLLLLDVDGRSYRYRVELLRDGKAAATIDRTESSCRGWQALTCETVECDAIRVTFTGTSLQAQSYHVVELAAYHQDDPTQKSALQIAYEKQKGQRAATRAAAIDLTGVERAVLGVEELRSRAWGLPAGESIVREPDDAVAHRVVLFRDGKTLLAGLDEDDDAQPNDKRPDTDSDCWVADYGGDGTIDRVIDYADNDSDGDADVMVLYLVSSNIWSRRNMTCVVIEDLDDDNDLWTLVNYEYQQGPCQWKCDFVGDNCFAMGMYSDRTGTWSSHWENPFCFYDTDGDGCAEIAIRIRAVDMQAHTLRYSFDTDNDSTPDNPKDYDFSVTALGKVQWPADADAKYRLRGGKPLHFIRWERTLPESLKAAWSRALLCWDEDDDNVNPRGGSDRGRERWEGVIAPAWGGFPQEGGPSVSRLNKRFELDADYSGELQFYFSEIDRRLHLLGAEKGGLDADWDYDGYVDARWRMEDTDSDGFFDAWERDGDGDGKFEISLRCEDDKREILPPDYEPIHKAHLKALTEARKRNESLIERLAKQGATSRVTAHWNDARRAARQKAKGGSEAQFARYVSDLAIGELVAAALEGKTEDEREQFMQACVAEGISAAAERLLGDTDP